MTQVLTYVEIDIPAWTQSSPDSPPTEFTVRFSTDTDYLPNSIPAIPSITDISLSPAIVSLGENLGQRGSVTVTFRDHRHIFDGESFDSGTFWGKFRARYGQTVQRKPFRLIRGDVGQDLEDMETRHYLIDSIDGPDNSGLWKLTAKDVLTFANVDKAQAPFLSEGILSFDLLAADFDITVEPAGVGADYPVGSYIAIGGREIAQVFSRTGDDITLSRSYFNTETIDHQAGERVQACLVFTGAAPEAILNELLTTYAGVDEDFIPYTDWETETAAFLGNAYTAVIANPTDVNKLISELIEQAALAVWWDDVGQQIRLQVLRQIGTDADTYDPTMTLADSLSVTEQPEKRISEVQVYFAKINPLVQDDEDDNYFSVFRLSDDAAVIEYGSANIKKIRSRWIAAGGDTTAEVLANKILGRFRDPPRLAKFNIMRDQPLDPQLGTGYQLEGTPFQTVTGAADSIPIQITRLEPRADYFGIEAEEMLWSPFGADINPNTRSIIFSFDQFNINLRTVHDSLYTAPTAGNIVNATILTNVLIVSASTSLPAFDLGSWPVGVTVNLTILGRIQGAGGIGGAGGSGDGNLQTLVPGTAGSAGGTALYTRRAFNLTSTNGAIWGGGGGGGGGGGVVSTAPPPTMALGGGGGGGGAGYLPGLGVPGGVPSSVDIREIGGSGFPGDSEAAGLGGTNSLNGGIAGGVGGAPGVAGNTGGTTAVVAGQQGSAGGAGGAAGTAIDGVSFVTNVGAPGDILGPTLN